MERYELNEVFRWATLPEVTLVDRSKTTEARKLALYLTQPGLIVGLHGASQTGKTALCETLLGSRSPMLIAGQGLENSAAFWDQLGDALHVESSVSSREGREQSSTREETTGGRLGLSIPILSIGGKIQSNSGVEDVRQTERISSWAPRSRQAIEETLAASKRPIIIDDFHWIDRVVQKEILDSLKPIGRRGTTIVLITAEESALAPLRKIAEFQNRYELIEAPNWKPASIALIARKGFAALNMSVDDNVVRQLASAARRNPLMMQKLCWEYCFAQSVSETQEDNFVGRNDSMFIESVYKKIARKQYEFYQDTIECGQRVYQKDRRRLNLREVIFIVLSNIETNQRISLRNLMTRIVRFLGSDAPSERVVAQELGAVSAAFAEHQHRAPFRYDETDLRCTVLQPEFLMAIRYHLAPKFGF